MSSRDVVLGRIREALSDRPRDELPPTPEVWPETGADVATMADRFASELEIVQGELIRCESIESARQELGRLVEQLHGRQGDSVSKPGSGPDALIGAVDQPALRQLAEGLDAQTVAWAADDWTAPGMSHLAAGLVEAEYLLADTGSCLVASSTSQERLLCYLPPVCIVLARSDRLREHLPAAWKEIAPRVAEPERRGEFVIITGPSRTADIEKILILGVHGPKRVVVLLVDTPL
ncbi:MAG: lactate utilization protein [Pirellulales bacterium]|nr:lactate utilization protein [Pirellulales bacterium]